MIPMKKPFYMFDDDFLKPISPFVISCRNLAKGKDRGGKEKRSEKPKVILDDMEMNKVFDYEEFKLEVEDAIESMKVELRDNLNIRMNPKKVESLPIMFNGERIQLNDIVTVSRKQQELVINLGATPDAVKPAMQAILDSGLGLNPQLDGNTIFIRYPKVTTEHRQTLIKSVRMLGQQTKDRIKDRNLLKRFTHKSESKKLSRDLLNDANSNVQYYIKEKCSEIDEIISTKVHSLEN
ncbi:hypothetical protein RDWZM_010406 [Blomia tropicalis]|uniref:Ribosome-recycling factor, mitochondrial n=1 Tax=Blomia tropicalis TaxID=40697 RepID=A0A9Q0RK29_BLOTA|nr:hypothetical protein RDWZM_010406 [Blomia tropicalis]